MKSDALCPLFALHRDLAPTCQQTHTFFSWSEELVLLDNNTVIGNRSGKQEQGSDFKQTKGKYRIKISSIVQTLSFTHQNVSL